MLLTKEHDRNAFDWGVLALNNTPRAMLVHAKDDSAKRFYVKFGFAPSPIDAYHLFLRLGDILSSLG